MDISWEEFIVVPASYPYLERLSTHSQFFDIFDEVKNLFFKTLNQPNFLKAIFIALAFFLIQLNGVAQNIEVLISGIRAKSGQIQLKVYKDDKGFQEDVHYKYFVYRKEQIRNGNLLVKFALEPGVYGFALLDDENADGIMNYNFIGMPKEGFGFSNFYLTGFSKPKFEAFKFTVHPNQQVKVTMKIRYV